jgi:hypothetical protein
MSDDEVMATLQTLKIHVEKAKELVSNHRHKNIAFNDCPECMLKQRIKLIEQGLSNILDKRKG